jgi:hypothetical protein
MQLRDHSKSDDVCINKSGSSLHIQIQATEVRHFVSSESADQSDRLLFLKPYLQWSCGCLNYGRIISHKRLNSKALSFALSSKELLALSTPLALAARTPQSHLLAADQSTIQVGLGNIC